MSRKHPNIVNLTEVEPVIQEKGTRFGFKGKRLGPQVGAQKIGCSYAEILPGKQAFPQHYHCANEEAVFVIEGRGHVRIGDKKIEISAGDYIAFPVGPDYAHSVTNTSDAPLKLLMMSTLIPVEIVGYPDSKKIGAAAMPDASKGFFSTAAPWVRTMIKEQPSADYYEGEEIN